MDYLVETCCPSMGSMINEGTLIPSLALGQERQEAGQMEVKGKEGNIINYNNVKYCPFCGRNLKLIQQ